ncbi:hypothetical protein QYM36_014800 [Artemia franciscana]|uniref:Uncharacterized protein n=1 Tax=Artemia franciscana TaxID=6661 RepID=A0AA88HG89_ARTSF|nr:hypothetical protein QYM36_014800 [Artemia franciscana]
MKLRKVDYRRVPPYVRYHSSANITSRPLQAVDLDAALYLVMECFEESPVLIWQADGPHDAPQGIPVDSIESSSEVDKSDE